MVFIEGFPVLFYKNPDATADIQCAALAVYYGQIVAYLYLNNNYVYFYWYDDDLKDYRLNNCDQETWKQNFKNYCLEVVGQSV